MATGNSTPQAIPIHRVRKALGRPRKADDYDAMKDRKFYRVGEVWGTESERELTRRCRIERIVRAPGGVVV